MWFQCVDCLYGTNSPKYAVAHMTITGHTTTKEKD